MDRTHNPRLPQRESSGTSSEQPGRGAPTTDDDAYERLARREADQVLERLSGPDPHEETEGEPLLTLSTPDEIVVRWSELSAVPGAEEGNARSAELELVDRALHGWVTGSRGKRKDVDGNVDQLRELLRALAAWHDAPGPADPKAAVIALERVVQAAYEHFAAERLLQEAAVAAHGEFTRMEESSARFAKKVNEFDSSRLHVRERSPVLEAHTLKDDRGALLPEAIEALDEEEKVQADRLRERAAQATVTVAPDVPPKDLKKAVTAKSLRNPVSGKTTVPELNNVVDRPKKMPATAEEMTEDIDGMAVTYDPSDVNAGPRIAALQKAIALVTPYLGVLPRLDVYFAKYGRPITVTRGKDGCEIQLEGNIDDAVFRPPGFLSVAPSAVGNPQVSRTDDSYDFSSTALAAKRGKPDEALVNTMVHELGHVAHYHRNKSQYYNLMFTTYQGTAPDGRPLTRYVAQEVSKYASRSPRELVAEVVLGVVRGRKFDPFVREVYLAFGGAPLWD